MELRKNCAEILWANSSTSVIPFGGKKSYLGTNPLAFGVDADVPLAEFEGGGFVQAFEGVFTCAVYAAVFSSHMAHLGGNMDDGCRRIPGLRVRLRFG